jgi:hypothetical protein
MTDLTFNFEALNDLTIEQIEWMEDALGGSLSAHLPTPDNPDRPMGRVLRAFGYAVMRAENPDFTVEDAGKLRVSFADSDPPTGAASS